MYDDMGVPEDERAYIVSEEVADKYWYYTYMAPDGTVLCKGETPYDYKSHPFTIKLFPYLNGKIHPFLATVIDQQRYINRLIVMNDMAIRSSFKGFKMIPTTVLNGKTKEQFMEDAIEYDGWIFYTPKRTMPNVERSLAGQDPFGRNIGCKICAGEPERHHFTLYHPIGYGRVYGEAGNQEVYDYPAVLRRRKKGL